MSIKTLPFYDARMEIIKLGALSKDRIGANYAKIVYSINWELGKLFKKHGNYDGTIPYYKLMERAQINEFNEHVEEIIKQNTKEAAFEIRDLMRKTVASSYDVTKNGIEQKTGRKIKGILNPATVNAIVQNPISGLKLDDRLAKNRMITVLTIKEELNRGLIQGKRYNEIAKQIEGRTGMEAGKALRIVRTESHRCLEAGKYESVASASNQGVELRKWWKNGDDERVRSDHLFMGRKYSKENAIPFDEDFVNEKTGGKGPHPGEMGVAADDINCRCMVMIEIIVPEETVKTGEKPKSAKKKKAEQKPVKPKEIKPTAVKPPKVEPVPIKPQVIKPVKTGSKTEYPISKDLLQSYLKNDDGDLVFDRPVSTKMSYDEFYQPTAEKDGEFVVYAHSNYKGSGYRNINSYMRYGKQKLQKRGYDEKTINGIIKRQQAVLNIINEKGTKMKRGTELYRGLGPNTGRKLLTRDIGEIFDDKAFMSFSLDPSVASGTFADDIRKNKNKGNPEGVVVRAILNGKERGIAGTSEEKEVIFPPNVRWQIVGKEHFVSKNKGDSNFTVITVISRTGEKINQ